VRAVRERDGIDVAVLRILHAENAEPHGGAVTYLAEVATSLHAEPWTGTLADHPLRNSFARPGGPAADLAWANSVIADRGLQPAGPPVQVKTWNLSSLWRIPLVGQTAWLKVVPPFFAHEGPLIRLLNGELVPTLLGESGGRMLLAEIPGRDLFDAAGQRLLDMVSLLVDLQTRWAARIDELLAVGVPDWRGAALTNLIADVFERTADEVFVDDRAVLAAFVATVPERLSEAAACGIPDTLVHGDFAPLNLRGDDHTLTLLDWGDSTIGHPLLDQAAFLGRIAREDVEAARRHWIAEWQHAVPGSDPARAFELLAPVATARQAAVYRRFLDHIEPAEHPYHRADPAERLRETARTLSAEIATTVHKIGP
jgi:Phosphotransferase enzyme family